MDVPAYLPEGLTPLRPQLLSCRMLHAAAEPLRAQLGCGPQHVSLGLVTADQDDALYAALDHATKFAAVDVVYAKSFYAGAGNASGPLSGEILGVLAGADPDEVQEGLTALRDYLDRFACFYTLADPTARFKPAFFPHVVTETGDYLSKLAGIERGASLAYLIAPPVESVLGVDAALKAAAVRLCRYFAPPTETNFGGAWLTGDLTACEAAAGAFAEAVVGAARRPLEAARRARR